MTEEIENNIDDVETNDSTEDNDEVDYKAQFETERANREKAEADANKWKDRAKKGYKKSNENKEATGIDQDAVQKMVDDSVGVVKFYSENKDAGQYQEDIEGLVAKGIERDKAFKYVVAEKDPSLLLDDAKKAQLNGNTALNGVPTDLNSKDYGNMTDEQLAGLSDAEFDEAFPSASSPKKFFAE